MIMDKRWRQEFAGMRGFREEDMVDEEVSLADIEPLKFPEDEAVRIAQLTGLFYGYFYKWDAAKHIKVCESLGWKPLEQIPKGSWVNYENCDMQYIDIREHIKYLNYLDLSSQKLQDSSQLMFCFRKIL